METASITIKLKGAKALQVLNGKGLLSVAKLKGAGAALAPAGLAKAAAVPAAEVEGVALLGNTTNVVGATEIEGTHIATATGNTGAQAVSAKVSAAKSSLAKPAALTGKMVAAQAPSAQALGAGASSAAVKLPALSAATASKSALTAGKAATGTIWSGTGLSLGLGLGLGAVGPALLLGALGLTATGIYLYRRNRHDPEAGPDPDSVLADVVSV